MTSSAPLRPRRPDRRGRRGVALLLLAVVLGAGACAPAPQATETSSPQAASIPPSSAPLPTESASPSLPPPTATAAPSPVVPADPCGEADPTCQSAAAVQQTTGIQFTDPVPCAVQGVTGVNAVPGASGTVTTYCNLQIDSFAPKAGEQLPVVVMIPGGPVPLGTRAYLWLLARLVAWKGAVVYTADYRSAPQWGGGYPQTFADVACAVAYARANAAKIGGDPSRITLLAHSFGGFPGSVVSLSQHDFATDEPACKAAGASGRPDAFVGVAAIYGFDHVGADFLAQMLGGTQQDVPANWAATDITTLATAKGHPKPPVLLLAGTADAVAPIATADEFAADLRAGGITATVTSVEGADHNTILADPATLSAVTALIGAKGQ